MTKKDIIRAWKDAEYRASLSEAERAMLPDHPAGLIELTDSEMAMVAGGASGKKVVCDVTHAHTCKGGCVPVVTKKC